MKSIILVTIIVCFGSGTAETLYDLCIIGAGLFGSAAARHASANAGLKICLIGPDEPLTIEEKKKRDVFGSHYDEARIVETMDPQTEIQILSRESIKAYRELERLSGINFYTPVGMLSIGKRYSQRMENIEQGASRLGRETVVDLSCNNVFEKRFPYMRIKDTEYALFDDRGAGYINPRRMIAAQQKVSFLQGCDIYPDIVKEVKHAARGFHEFAESFSSKEQRVKCGNVDDSWRKYCFSDYTEAEIVTEKHGKLSSKRVLFTTGAFTNFKDFHPLPLLNVTIFKQTVALLRISDEEAQKLSSMPSVIYGSEESDFEAYILPPVKYPDGNHYLKIGSMRLDFERQILSDSESVKKWYLKNGDPLIIERASKFLMKVLPSVKIERISGASCAIAITPSFLPYIDRVTPTVTVAVGGNGRGAKISEEVGRIAAHLSLTGRWDSELPQRLFNAIPQ